MKQTNPPTSELLCQFFHRDRKTRKGLGKGDAQG